MTKPVSYTKLKSTLDKLDAQISAAETHGLITGMLTLAPQPNQVAKWRDILLESMDSKKPTKGQWDVIQAIGDQIRSDFMEFKFSFKLLLPNDEQILEQRIDALGQWCRGYLSGLALLGLTKEDLKNEVIKELISDLSQISHISMETDSSEEDENNYLELVEFVRIAVQNIQLELQGSEHNKMLH